MPANDRVVITGMGIVSSIGIGKDEFWKNLILGKTDKMINYVPDRLGHDRRYSLDSTKIKKLGWQPSKNFNTAIKETINWYKANTTWWQKLKNV